MSRRGWNEADVERSALVVEEAFEEYARYREVDFVAKTIQKIDLSGDEFLAFKLKCVDCTMPVYGVGADTLGMDYVVSQRAMFIRQRKPFHLNLTAYVVHLLSAKINGMADVEGLEPLRARIGQIRTNYNARLKIETEGVHRNGDLVHTSHRNADVQIYLEPASRIVLAEVVVEITDPVKRALCPEMGREYVRRMLREHMQRRSCTTYFAINLDDETKAASYTVVIGWWTMHNRPGGDDLQRTRASMHVKFLRNETVFRDRNGQLVPGTVRFLAQNILGRYTVAEAFRRRGRRALRQALNMRAITIDHQELFNMLEEAEQPGASRSRVVLEARMSSYP